MGRTQVNKLHIGFRLGLSFARRYYSAAADILPVDPKQLEPDFSTNSADIAFAASSLIFATELYLRNAANDRINSPRHHNLWTHYRRISKSNQETLAKKFNEKIRQRRDPVSLHVVVSQGKRLQDQQVKDLESKDPNQSKGDFLSLERILKDTGESYNTWRYAYQTIVQGKQHKILRLHYVHLFCLCEVIEQVLSEAYSRDRQGIAPK